MSTRLFAFVGGPVGLWRVSGMRAVTGPPLSAAARVDIVPGGVSRLPAGASWLLRGVTSNQRYVTRAEHEELTRRQPSLGRPEATCAALIPISKSAAWWALSQDERRDILEEQSRHIAIGLRYLPAIARRLHHCRDLDEREPFDFLTWFEFAPHDLPAFDELLRQLRASAEWTFVEREVEIRLVRDASPGERVQPAVAVSTVAR